MHHHTDRIIHTTAFVTPVVEHWLEREIAQWVHPMKDWSDDPSHHERMLLPRSYISLHHEGLIQRPKAPWANALTTELHLAPLTVRCNSMVECLLMVWWVVGIIPHWAISCFGHGLYNKGYGTWYPVCRMVHIKESLLLIEMFSPWGDGSRFPFWLSQWSFTMSDIELGDRRSLYKQVKDYYLIMLKISCLISFYSELKQG